MTIEEARIYCREHNYFCDILTHIKSLPDKIITEYLNSDKDTSIILNGDKIIKVCYVKGYVTDPGIYKDTLEEAKKRGLI